MQPGDPLPGPFDPVFYSRATGYMNNSNLMPTLHRLALSRGWFPGVPSGVADIGSPAQVVIIAEGMGYIGHTGGDDWTSGCTGYESGYPIMPGRIIGRADDYCAGRYRHHGGAVYALADGHVKWFKGPGPSWRTPSTSNVAWRRSLVPSASAWFRED